MSISHFFIAATLVLATIILHLDYYNMYPVDIPISMLAPSTHYSQHITQSNSVKLLKKIILTLFKNIHCISHIKSSKGWSPKRGLVDLTWLSPFTSYLIPTTLIHAGAVSLSTLLLFFAHSKQCPTQSFYIYFLIWLKYFSPFSPYISYFIHICIREKKLTK